MGLLAGCGGDGEGSGASGSGGTGDSDGGVESGVDAAPDTIKPEVGPDGEPDVAEDVEQDVPVVASCTSDQSLCVDHETRRYCEAGQWKEETCGAGSGCVGGKCVSGACSDSCRLGDTQGGKVCELYDVATGAWVTPDPAVSMHDRARAYAKWLHRDGMAFGGVGSARYSDPPTYSDVEYLDGLGDSAIWTGTYLAAEALRLKATGAADARKNVVDLVETLHLWFNVSGDPGMLARFVAPSNQTHPTQLGDLDCSAKRCHCGVSYGGAQYDYIGHISRDQYQGVMLGYALAYEALGENEEATRELIRKDVVELLQELMKERTVPMIVTFNGTPVGPLNVKMRFTVINNAELDNGAVNLIVDTSNYDDSEMYGFQEFMPNLALVLKQIPGLSLLVPATVPRSDSAVMLASFFNVALMVTDGVDAYETQRDEILTFYEANTESGGNVNDWIPIMAGWSYTNDCGNKYYANNIVMEPMYNLARLEIDLGRRGIIRSNVLDATMWEEFDTTKNSFFSFIYSAVTPGSAASIHQEATAQLSQFPPPPRIKVAVDLTADPKYLPHQDGCPNQTRHTGAVDVGERVVSDFLWQRHPWGLLDAGELAKTYPGVDYLVAYWMGRHHGYIGDDTSGKCTVWR
jgi:hypothetical protein